MTLPANGRCCGRKPLLYKSITDARIPTPHYFCVRCNRAYSIITGEQLENWAWMWVCGESGNQFVNRMPHMRKTLCDGAIFLTGAPGRFVCNCEREGSQSELVNDEGTWKHPKVKP